MCVNIKQFKFILIFIISYVFENSASPITNKNSLSEVLVEVPFGETVTLTCRSNDKNHNFHYWYINEKNTIVGPFNKDLDISKFNYEVLSGNLTIKAVSKEEEGVYHCVSRGIVKDDINIRSVRMLVQQDWEEISEPEPNVNLFRAVIAIATLILIGGLGYLAYTIWKNKYRRPSYIVPSDDEDDSADELFTAPGIPQGEDNLAKSNSTESLDVPGISTDFKSILDTASSK